MYSESTVPAEAKPNLSQLYFSRHGLPNPAKFNFFKTPVSVKVTDMRLGKRRQVYSTFLYRVVYILYGIPSFRCSGQSIFYKFPLRRTRARIVNVLRNPPCRAGTTTLFDVPDRKATLAGGIDSLELILGLLKRFQIRAQVNCVLQIL
jgi:hypothetical protein